MERIITGLMQRGPAVALRFVLRKAPKWTRYILWISVVCLAVSICFWAGLEGKTGDMSWTQTYYLTFAVGRGNGFFWGQGVGGESLTLEDVIRLSEKGNELEWAEVRFPCMSVFVKIPREKRRLISGRRMWRPL